MMDWATKRVLITGAGGFIGSRLAARLVEAGARVRALVRYNSRNDWGLLEVLPPRSESLPWKSVRGTSPILSGPCARWRAAR
jgi:nucleoside-diphosphate-sugar epimerase